MGGLEPLCRVLQNRVEDLRLSPRGGQFAALPQTAVESRYAEAPIAQPQGAAPGTGVKPPLARIS